ncbi:hypothetical protein [Nostoc linckia]|uniref:hypothetical protein n=1 Tax=Nostoc linckia TaxID=92942 RepID=UPI0015D50670|nr:hypothetical protein [Nostoc linckia]
MSKRANIIQQNKRRKKRGLKPRRSGWFLSVMLVPSLKKSTERTSSAFSHGDFKH